MKKTLFTIGFTFISVFSLTFIPEVRYFFWGILSILFLFSAGAGFLGFRWLKEFVEIKKEERLIKKAERERVEVQTVIVNDNQVLHIKENGYWRNATLDRRTYANGRDTQASDQDIAAWMAFMFRKNPQQLPPMADQSYLEDQNLISQPLPEKINLEEILPSMTGTLRNIVLGVRIDEQGQEKTVSAPMFRLCHVGVAGSTDSGKSNFGRSIAYQVATSIESVHMVISDLKGTTFKPFSNCDKLLYPILGTVPEFLAVMQELKSELDRRKGLFKKHVTVETLADYNKIAEPLPMIVIFIDEVSNLFLFKQTQDISLGMLREARAFGMFFLAMGQSWSHKEMSTSIRQQFRTGVHFGTNDPTSSRMMTQSSNASQITIPGRALATLPFGMSSGAVEIQTPYISNEVVLERFGKGEKYLTEIPEIKVDREGFTKKQNKIVDLYVSGITDEKEISERVYGQRGGEQYKIINSTLLRAGLV